jgi:hypothetical protein
MYDQERHEMQLETTHPSGAEEWFCTICGRRFLMQWPPEYKKIVLERGDENALHSGGKGGLRMGRPQIAQGEETLLMGHLGLAADEPHGADPVEDHDTPLTDELRPWLNWLKDAGLGDQCSEAA